MQLLKRTFLAGFLLGITGLCSLFAQGQLERISISERSDGVGYVVRYHLTEIVDSFDVVQPEIDRIQMRLYSPGIDTTSFVDPQVDDEVTSVELIRIERGIGVDITIGDGIFFLANAYPDQNLRDLLLSLEYSTMSEVEELAADTDPYSWPVIDVEEDGDPEAEPGSTAETASEEEPTGEPGSTQSHEQRRDLLVQREPIFVRFGVAGGVSQSNVLGAGYSSTPRKEITMGITAYVNLPYVLPYLIKTGIETGIFYTQKGFWDPPGKFDAETVALDYIEVPVMGKFSYELNEIITPHLAAGFYTAFISSAETIQGDGDRSDLDEVTKSLDMGGAFGVGSDISLGRTTVTLQMRYTAGFTSMFNDGFSEKEKNSTLSLSMGIRF